MASSCFHYELPTTGAIAFGDLCTDMSADKVYGRHIADATQSRANLRGVLKEAKRTDGEKDYLRVVKVRFSLTCFSSLHRGESEADVEGDRCWTTTSRGCARSSNAWRMMRLLSRPSPVRLFLIS